MDVAYFRMLFDYNRWANARILERCAELAPEEFARPVGLSMGSIRGVLAHQLGTEVIWLTRFRGESPTAILAEPDFPDLAAMLERWRSQDVDQQSYLSALSDEDVNGSITYRTTRGEAFTQILGHVLAHVVNHGTQFRSEAGVALSQLGHSPGDTDLSVYLRSHS